MTRKLNFIFTLLLTMLFLSLSGCTGGTPTSAPEEPMEEPTEESAPDPEPAPVMEAADVDHCLDCHTDKQHLISTAKPVEIVISENDGAG